MNKKRSKKKIVLSILAGVLVFMIVGWFAFTVFMYNENFNLRFESYEALKLHVEDFEGLNCAEYKFPSDKGQKLAGYMYSSGENQRGIIVLAHGFGGGGHNSYMDCINYFAHNGYYVFAYDAIGCDKSEGEGVGGVPQGVIDLEHAISFVEESGNFPELPICLFGHSWGGYSACNVLTFHPEVKGVVECSGCNSSADMFEGGGKSQAGDVIYTMTPFVKLYERFKFGKYATNTAMKGFESSDAKVMVVHSEDDGVLPIEYGYNIYYEKYKDDPRFVFLHFDDKGHNSILNDPNDTYADELDADFANWVETLDYDYKADENKDRFIQDKTEYLNKNLDRARWANRLDTELFDKFIDFYDKCL